MCIALVGVTFDNEPLLTPFLMREPFQRIRTVAGPGQPVEKPGPVISK
jgi:hypothetical protein